MTHGHTGRRVQSVQRALDLASLVASRSEGMRLGELAAASGLARSTAHTLLTTLESLGYVHQPVPAGPYAITDRFAELGRGAVHTSLPRGTTRVLLEGLSRTFGHTALLLVPTEHDVICIDAAYSRTGLRRFGAGSRFSYVASASGQVLLAVRPATLARLRDRQPAEVHQVHERIEMARARGFAVHRGAVDGERTTSVAVGLRGRTTATATGPEAAVCLIGLADTFSLGRAVEVGPDLLTAVEAVAGAHG